MKLENLEVFNFKGAFRGMRNPMNSWDKSDSFFGMISCEEDPDLDYDIAENWIENENKLRVNRGLEPYKEWSDKWEELWAKYDRWLLDVGCLSFDGEDRSHSTIFNMAYVGPKDLKLAQKLIRAGGEHRKFLRQIIVSFDLTAPLYFWKEFDTYKVGTVANSTSTMHKLASTPITLDCFETDDYEPGLIYLEGTDDSGDYPFDYHLCISDMVGTENNMNSYYEPTIIKFLEELRQKYLKTKDKAYWKELIRWLPESWLQTRTITMNYENILNLIHQRNNHKLSEWRWLVNNFKEKLPYAYELLFFTLEENK